MTLLETVRFSALPERVLISVASAAKRDALLSVTAQVVADRRPGEANRLLRRI